MKKLILFALLLGLGSLALYLPTPPPPQAIGPYLNGVFPESPPGNSWTLEEPFPGIVLPAPLRILPLPGTEDWLVLCKKGEVWRVSPADQTQTKVLDITDRSFKRGEAGTVGMALHPEFGNPAAPDKQLIFVFYRYKPDPDTWSEKGFNRLSKFTWDSDSELFDPNSEEILIQQYDRSTWHNGGGMFFGPDSLLYLALGDEGDADFIPESTQRLDGGLFSGIIRIDIDNRPYRSHPIIRQPTANGIPPAGWGETFTQGYGIPNDNPWLSPDGSQLEEFYAIGIRSPYNMVWDDVMENIWMTDVGEARREEIDWVAMGDNLQWPYREGSLPSEDHVQPDPYIGQEKPFYFEYDRPVGSCVIGGSIYRESLFTELQGKFLFADWVSGRLMALSNTNGSDTPEMEVLIGNIAAEGIDLPEQPGITGIFPMSDGEIYLTVMGEDAFVAGKILRLKAQEVVPDPPTQLSDLGVFTDLETLTPAPGLIPYGVNAPLWSDRAVKKRWMAVPNDGTFDMPDEQINFSEVSDWAFPEGTVFVKHFDLPLTTDPNGPLRRLETRFFIVGKGGQGYGLTYKWNEAGTEAFLQGAGTSQEFAITENGEPAYTQRWDYPGRDQCLSCHNPNANYVLGVKTHQLNGDFVYEGFGPMNQLEYLSLYGIIHTSPGDTDRLPRAVAIDDETAGLDLRVRSYLDSNCSSCHRLGGVNMLTMDFRFSLPLNLQNIINFPTLSLASNSDNLLVEPGYHAYSELWVRDASLTENRMPPLGSNLVDEVYVDVLAEWIDQLPEDAGQAPEHILFPNPTTGWLNMRLSDEWEPPFQVRVFATSGQFMFTQTTSGLSMQLDLSYLPRGPYFVEICNAQDCETRKVILQ